MPRYAYPQPTPPECEVDGCDRTRMSWTNRVCSRHYQARWREKNRDRMDAARDRYDERVGRRQYAPKT